MYILNFNSLGHRELSQYGVRFCKKEVKMLFLDASSHLYKRVCPSVRWSISHSVRPSVPRFFFVHFIDSGYLWVTLGDFENASIGRLSALLDASSHLYKRVCPSICWSVHPSVPHFFSFILLTQDNSG